jgi:hypothetical protein
MLGFKVTFSFDVTYKQKDKAKYYGCRWTGKRWIKEYNCNLESLIGELYEDKKLFICFDVINIEGLSIDEEDVIVLREHISKIKDQHYKRVEEQFKKISQLDEELNDPEYIKMINSL